MAPQQANTNTPSTQPTVILARFHNLRRKPILRKLFTTTTTTAAASSRVRPDKTEPRELDQVECLRQEAEATFDLHDSMERWMRGDDPTFGAPSQRWKALHPQMNYHLQRIRHREQHELWGAGRLPACKEKDRATIAFLNCGGDPEETRGWPEGLEEEFLNSLIWQWKSDTGV